MHLKKQLIAGAVITIITICVLLESISVVVEQKQYIPSVLVGKAAVLLGSITIIYTIGLLAFGTWSSFSRSTRLEILNKRYTLIATIPAYFGFALLPVFFGLILVILTDQTTWGFWLSCLSIPTILIFLLLEIRKLQR